MNGKPVTQREIQKMKRMRATGHSIPEIRTALKRGSGTVFSHIKNVEILPEYKDAWETKRGGNKKRAASRWKKAEECVSKIFPKNLSQREQLIIASALYWGEGTKREFGFTNSDPSMIKTLVRCLETLNIPKERLRVSIRIYDSIDRNEAVNFWAEVVGIPPDAVLSVNVLTGKKVGKLKFGMCRIRITRGQDVFKILQSAIKKITVSMGTTSS